MDSKGYGVSRLSIVPVRVEANHKAEQATQLLFGDHYEVTDEKVGKWIKIRTAYDQYEGWIDIKQHTQVIRDYFEYLHRAEFKITTDLTSTILYNKNPLIILLGSMIPISSSELFKMEEQFAFNGEAKSLGQKREFEYLKNIAYKYINTPYLWGGKSPFGIDCSGFTQMVYKICGYKLFRDAYQQANQGKGVPSINELSPGDLVFFNNDEGKVSHVGIYLGKEKIIHASGRVRIDVLNQEGILNMESKIISHPFSHARRLLPE